MQANVPLPCDLERNRFSAFHPNVCAHTCRFIIGIPARKRQAQEETSEVSVGETDTDPVCMVKMKRDQGFQEEVCNHCDADQTLV
jgi:hypothetical protein